MFDEKITQFADLPLDGRDYKTQIAIAKRQISSVP